MSAKLHLRLLGHPEVLLDDRPVTGFISTKVQALLYYLAVSGRPHTRSQLAGLLWGEKAEEAALLNLRKALSNLRHQVGSHIIITRQTVAFNRQAPYELDVESFERLLRGKQHALRDLRRAMALYRGDFLDGFYVKGAPAFEEWVLLKRARLQAEAEEAGRTLIERYIRRGEYRTAIRYARQLLAMTPWQESIHRRLMWLLAHTGRRDEALAQYERCRRLLADELGVEPMAETTALYERILAAREIKPPPLPPQPTPFVGREGEIRGIIRRLTNRRCRLLTLWGPGGVGKTRLALQVAHRLRESFLHGVYFVPLATTSPPAIPHLPYAIAGTLQVALQGGVDPTTRLLDFLREKELLLVLDNFEHLMDGVPFLARLLEAAPEVKLLVTSRERLRSRWEWLFEVHGLPVPEHGEERPRRFAGIKLFLQEAHRIRPHFDDEGAMEAIIRICRAVEGLPLGIELAAALLDEHTATEIAAGIEQRLDFLRSPMQDIPRRHRSLQAAFEHSWSLLGEHERRAFRRLAVFRGSFDAEAAAAIADIPPALLATLEAKSLLRRTPDNRYEMLEVLRQYAEEQLRQAGEEWEEIHIRHCAYYTGRLRQLWADMRHGKVADPSVRLSPLLDNARTAYRWAVRRGNWQAVGHLLPPLLDFYMRRSWFREGERAAIEAVTILRQVVAEGEPEARALLGSSLSRLGMIAQALGRYDEARALLEESLQLAEEAGDQWEVAFALNNLAIITTSGGHYRAANRLFERSLALFVAAGDRRMEAVLLNNLGLTYRVLGEHEEARRLCQESLRRCREGGFRTEEARAILSLGIVAHSQEHYEEAIRHYRQGLALFRALGDRWGEAMTLGNLGAALTEQGAYAAARRVLTESLALRRAVGDRLGSVIALNNLGRVAARQGAFDAAFTYLSEALALAEAIPSVPVALDALAEIARLREQQGEAEEALKLAAFVARHPATDDLTRREMETLVTSLAQRLPPAAMTAARQWGEGQKVMTIAHRVRMPRE